MQDQMLNPEVPQTKTIKQQSQIFFDPVFHTLKHKNSWFCSYQGNLNNDYPINNILPLYLVTCGNHPCLKKKLSFSLHFHLQIVVVMYKPIVLYNSISQHLPTINKK